LLFKNLILSWGYGRLFQKFHLMSSSPWHLKALNAQVPKHFSV
jgi:hypothetical protein